MWGLFGAVSEDLVESHGAVDTKNEEENTGEGESVANDKPLSVDAREDR